MEKHTLSPSKILQTEARPINAEDIALVKRHYGRVLQDPTFYDRFYELFKESHPGIRRRFDGGVDMQQQMHLLRHGMQLMIMFAGGNMAGEHGLNRIHRTHGEKGMNVPLEFYQIWKKCYLMVLKEIDPKMAPELEGAWSRVLDRGIAYVAAGNEFHEN